MLFKRFTNESRIRLKTTRWTVPTLLLATLLTIMHLVNVWQKLVTNNRISVLAGSWKPRHASELNLAVYERQESDKNRLHIKILPSIENYCQWHKKQRACMIDQSCDSGNPQLLVWQCPFNKYSSCGGLGDRLRGIHFSFLLAIVTRKFFLVDWPDEPFPIQTGLLPAGIDWTVTKSIDFADAPVLAHNHLPNIEWRECPPSHICKLNATKYPKKIRDEKQIISQRQRIDSGDIKEQLKNFDKLIIVARASLQSVQQLSTNEKVMKDFEDLKDGNVSAFHLSKQLLQSLFKPSNVVKYEIAKRIKRHPDNEYIAVHVRTGYDFGEMDIRRFEGLHQSRSDIAQKFVYCAFNHMRGKNIQIFLASDSKTFKQDFSLVSEQFNLSVYFSHIPGLHIGLLRGIPSDLEKSKRHLAHINTFVDFFSIAYSKTIIGNGSGFSRMAYLLGNASRLIEIHSDDDLKKCSPTGSRFNIVKTNPI